MKTIFLVALMNLMSVDGYQHVYVFTKPTFTTIEECKDWGRQNTPIIAQQLYREYGPNIGPPQMVSCVNEDIVRKIQLAQDGKTDT